MVNTILKTELIAFLDYEKYNRIFAVFSNTKYQACCVHLSRNISHKVRGADRAEICEDFKSVYWEESLDLGEEAMKDFVENGKLPIQK